MKRLLVFLFIAIQTLLVGANELTVGTNTFYYCFEDLTLSSAMKNKILSELETIQHPWVEREYDLFSWRTTDASSVNGFVRFNNIATQPFLYQIRMNEFHFKTNSNGRFEILLSKKQTDIFTNAFRFINNHQDAWNEATNFYAYFKDNALTNLPVGNLNNIYYHPNLTPAISILAHTNFVNDLLTFDYNQPNALGIAELPAGFLDYPEQTLWLALPITDKNGEGRFNRKWHDVFYCVWRNGHWYIWANRWAGM